MGSHYLLQGIFLTQGLNPGLPHCRQTLYHLNQQGSPKVALGFLKKYSPNPLSFRRTLSPSEGSRWQLHSIFTAPQTEHIPADNSEYSVSSQLWQGCSDGPPPKPWWPLLLSCPWGCWLPTSHIKVLMWFRLEAECRWFPGKKTEHATDDSAMQGHEVKGSISQEVWWSLHLLDPLAKERWQGTLFPLWQRWGLETLLNQRYIPSVPQPQPPYSPNCPAEPKEFLVAIKFLKAQKHWVYSEPSLKCAPVARLSVSKENSF